MVSIKLHQHKDQYAEDIFHITSDPKVMEHLSFQNKTIEDVFSFIHMVQNEERQGKTISRIILDEKDQLIGTTTLININHDQKTASLGSWLKQSTWGKGYNELAKREILMIAFKQLGLEKVFVGARKANYRSIRAQEKLGYVTFDVGNKYPDEFQKLAEREKQPIILNVVYKTNFFEAQNFFS